MNPLRTALLAILDAADYTADNCRPNEMVSAVLDNRVLITNAREALSSASNDDVPLYGTERAALSNAAKLLDAEAATWAEGFGVVDEGVLVWTPDCHWAHVRHTKLVNSAARLREIVARLERKAAKEAAKK